MSGWEIVDHGVEHFLRTNRRYQLRLEVGLLPMYLWIEGDGPLVFTMAQSIVVDLNSHEALLEAARAALKKINDHDHAKWQCESVEGAQAIDDAKQIIEKAIAQAAAVRP